MGISIVSKNQKRDLNGGYGGFMNLRKRIALNLDKEFGEHYARLGTFWNEDEYKVFDKETTRILSDSRFKQELQEVITFLFAEDSKGKISYKTCKQILDIIKDDNKPLVFTYGAYSDGNDWQYFKEFLQDCYSNRKNMEWY